LAQDSNTAGIRKIPRGLQFALFITALAWAGAASAIAERAAQGICVRFNLVAFQPLIEAFFLLFLVVVGFKALDWVAGRGRQRIEVLPLPRRPGWPTEWGVGAAIGWTLSLLAVMPLLLTGHLHSIVAIRTSQFGPIAAAILTLLVVTIAQEAIFRGYPFQRLTEAIGPSWASILLSVGFGIMLVSANPPGHLFMAVLGGSVFGLILSMAYLRTHGLWVGWGLHFAYRAVTAVILGLPIAGNVNLDSITNTYAAGPRWLTGGAFGPDAALLTTLIMLVGMALLYRATKEYAWQYTLSPIVSAGYEVTIAPPAAHVALEKATAPPPLVQILSTTSQTRSISGSPAFDNEVEPLPPQ
jgi:membrane protease YdiL (CAAX protease family)